MFASHQIYIYNSLQARIIRKYSPGKFITHNFEDFSHHFNHFKIGKDLDFVSWDNYPLGTLETSDLDLASGEFEKTGDPNAAAFHHDLYRNVGKGRFWIMEQQVGPISWGRNCPVPAPGMVRLWSWEAFAHGAEVVSYFRWRQVPFGAEQMHSGLLLSDGRSTPGFHEVRQVARELSRIMLPPITPAPVALIFDYQAAWVQEVEPYVETWSYIELVFLFYKALRKLGLDIDIIPPAYPLSSYRLVVIPTLPIVSEEALRCFTDADCPILFGPRSGSKTAQFHIPSALPPGPLKKLLSIDILAVGGTAKEEVWWNGKAYSIGIWREWIRSELLPWAHFRDGSGAAYRHGRFLYIGFWPSKEFLIDLFERLAREVGLKTVRLPEGLRIRRRGKYVFACNYSSQPYEVPASPRAHFILGKRMLPAHEVAIWEEKR